MQLSENIKTARTLAGLSQAAFGALFGGTKDMVFSYENGKAAPSDEAVKLAAELIGITTDQFGKVKLKPGDYKKEQVKARAFEIIAAKKNQSATNQDFKDKYIEALETIVKKQEALLHKVEASMNSFNSRLAAVEKGLHGAKHNQQVMYALQNEFQNYVLEFASWSNKGGDARKIVQGKAVAYLRKHRKEDIRI